MQSPSQPLSGQERMEEEKFSTRHQLISTLEGSVLPLQNKKVPEKERFTNSLQALLSKHCQMK